MDRKNGRFRFFFLVFTYFSVRIPLDVIVHDSSNKSNILFLLFVVYIFVSKYFCSLKQYIILSNGFARQRHHYNNSIKIILINEILLFFS